MKKYIEDIIKNLPGVSEYEGVNFTRFRLEGRERRTDAYIFSGLEPILLDDLEKEYNMTLPVALDKILIDMNGMILFDQELAAFGVVKKFSRNLDESVANPFSVFGYLRVDKSIDATQVGVWEEDGEHQSKVYLSNNGNNVYIKHESGEIIDTNMKYEDFFITRTEEIAKKILELR